VRKQRTKGREKLKASNTKRLNKLEEERGEALANRDENNEDSGNTEGKLHDFVALLAFAIAGGLRGFDLFSLLLLLG